MRKLYLICNAHIDPVWQWEWDEGLGVALSTFKIAADLCEEFDAFIFNHNEAILYEWIEEYDIELFSRIKKLIENKKWHIMGGWYLQPDCNMPSGESIIRQITAGHKFFDDNFNTFPKTAVNFDTFGHSKGIVQILKKAGYETYMFMRPDKGSGMLEQLPQFFIWEGFGGNSIPAYRLETQYSTPLGKARAHIENYIKSRPHSELSLKTWGIGNHGGGPSKQDLTDITQMAEEYKDEIEIIHSTPDDFFERVEQNNLPVWNKCLNPMFIGCYTSMHDIKKLYRELENKLYMTEKTITAAVSRGLSDYPYEELSEVNKILVASAFHDTLSGTISKKPEQDAIRSLHYGLEILSKIFTKAFYAFANCHEPAKPGSIPVFVYNPHPYPVKDIFECEYTLPDYNWGDSHHKPILYKNGMPVICQSERESGNVPLEYRKRIVFETELSPMCLDRFDCFFEEIPKPAVPSTIINDGYIMIKGSLSEVKINIATGSIDFYSVNGRNMVTENFCRLSVYEDSVDPWGMGIKAISNQIGCFQLMDCKKASEFAGVRGSSLAPVRIVEDGDVRTVAEVLMEYNNSSARILYKIPKNSAFIDVELTVYWNEKSKLLRLCLPSSFTDSKFLGQTMFGVNELNSDSEESVHQNWAAVTDILQNKTLTVINDSVYGLECGNNEIRISLLRAPAYAAMPIGDREIVPQHRFSHRIDQGEKIFNFRIEGGPDRLRNIDLEAQQFGEKPHALNIFPTSSKRFIQKAPLIIGGARLETFLPSSETGIYIFRLFNTADKKSDICIESQLFDLKTTVLFEPYEFKTFKISKNDFYETDLFENRL
ncbi:MAG: glycoside hydrolase family 38 N-terminal domain-containing protein [Eubacteriales bacterium]